MVDDDRDNAHLLKAIQEALTKWREAEELFMYQDIYTKKNDHILNIERLKQAYIDLLKEAKKRNLSLTKDQMAERIFSKSLDTD
ncbi:MAG: hypothetical protein WC097_01760 [Eubacteriales bacterium]|jgi:hypothetical protein|nr:DUF2508 family protein [Clostridia bacterium]